MATAERGRETARTEASVTEGPVRRLPWEGLLAVAMLLAAWQWASTHSTPMFFPPFRQIIAAIVSLLSTPDGWVSLGTTYGRIVLYLLASFVISTLLGLLVIWSPHADRFFAPLIELKQGIPAVCWVLFAVLWFANTEARIGFVVVTSALPAFFYQIRDSLRSIPRDWIELVN
jgi:NitT/TauT family transport system permease protein